MCPVLKHKGVEPQVHESAYIDELARIIGDVRIGEHVYIGPGVTIRGDLGRVTIGNYVVIQDNATIYPPEVFLDGTLDHGSIIIGNYVLIGKGAVVQGSYIADYCFIGNNAVIERESQLNQGDVILPGSVVPNKAVVPPESVMAGNPANLIRKLSHGEQERHEEFIEAYIRFVETFEKTK